MAENGNVSPQRISFIKKLTKTFSFDSKEEFFRRFNNHFHNVSKHKPWSSMMKLSSSSDLSITLPSSPDTSKRECRKRSLSTSSVELGHFPYSGLMPAPSPRFSTSSLDAVRKQAKQDNNLMVLKLARTEQQLHEALEKNKTVTQRTKDEHGRITLSMHQLVEQLVEKGEQLDEAHHQIEVLTNKLEREIQCSAELYQKVKDLENQLEKNESGFHSNNVSILTDTNDNELKFDSSKLNESLELIEQLKRSTTPIGDLMLSCTLCNERIAVEEIESHSSICSSGSADKSKSRVSEPRTPRSPGMLVATVTSCERDSISPDVDTPFKIICKTTIPDYKKTFLTSEKNREDFIWFRNALEEFHPERVIPPLSFHDDLSHNMRELQRFLSRICGHKIFKNDTLVRKFLSANAKEMEKLKKSFKKQVHALLKHKKPAIEVVDEEGLLYKTQIYISQFMENLSVLIHFFKTNNGKETINGVSECFVNLGKCEQNETYVQTVFQGLGGIIAELENKTNVLYDQSALAEDLESLLYFVKAADELLYRVECSVNTFLYWEEEIRVFEEMKSDGLVTSTNGKDITHLWAEASSNCRTAKDELERMCRDLSDELSEFDIRKEKELKQILIEYADSRCDVFEKMQSKWFGVKLMLDGDIVPSIRAINFSSHK